MYFPAAFSVTDVALIREIIREHPFAVVVGGGPEPFATHVPVIAVSGSSGELRLSAHIAKANPHGQLLAGSPEALVIFNGPHAYVSPRWYASRPAVPTWNYIAIHAHVHVRIIEDPAQLESMVRTLSDAFEGADAPDSPAGFRERMLHGIVGLDMSVRRIEAKFKLGQNRSAADVAGVISVLRQSSDSNARAIADWMRRMAEAAIASEPTATKTSVTL